MTDLIALLRRRHTIANSLYLDLLDALPPDRLRARLPGVRSSPVSNHFWCVVGARESYVRAARAGSWQGFDCSLADDEDADQVRAALEHSAAEVDAWLGELDPGDADSDHDDAQCDAVRRGDSRSCRHRHRTAVRDAHRHRDGDRNCFGKLIAQ